MAEENLEVKSNKQIIKEIHENAYKIEVELTGGTMPVKAHWNDAGFDLYATADIKILPGQVIKHPLNFKMKLPRGTYGQITSKSGLGSKGLLVYAGIIDEQYRGIPHVVGTNLNWNATPFIDPEDGMENVAFDATPIEIKAGQKLAQLIIQPYSPHYFIEQVEKVNEDTDRSSGGFGSTGA